MLLYLTPKGVDPNSLVWDNGLTEKQTGTKMTRKTVDVASVKKLANTILSSGGTDDAAKSTRHGVILMVEQILLDTDNYKGFRYLPCVDITDGTVREYL